MFLQAKADSECALGVYLHVPFCAHTCDFCGFYQEAPRRSEMDRYLRGIERELQMRPPERAVDTVFWGGGTPGILTARDFDRLGSALLGHLEKPPSEWTVEMAPSTVKEDKIQVMRDLGVNRISIGVQSFSPRLLDALGRRHSRDQAYRAIEVIRNAGFENLNLDLIFAIPGQSPADWEADLREAMALRPEHLSTYCLTFEEDTALWLKLQKGDVRRLDEKDEIAFYETSWRLTQEAGYDQYEVSNYALPGFQCRHNCDTWRMQEWIGYGPSAASQYGGRRFQNTPSIDQWLEGLESGCIQEVDVSMIDDALLASDAVVFGLRMNSGVDLESLKRRFPDAPWGRFEEISRQCQDEGLIESDGSIWRLTPDGRLVADGVGVAFLD